MTRFINTLIFVCIFAIFGFDTNAATGQRAAPAQLSGEQLATHQEKLKNTVLKKYCADDGWRDTNDKPSRGKLDVQCDNANTPHVAIVCYNKIKNNVPPVELYDYCTGTIGKPNSASIKLDTAARPNNHYDSKQIGKTCEIENAKTAEYELHNHKLICVPTECKCGYEKPIGSLTKCTKWTSTSCQATNATDTERQCKNDKEVCVISECEKTHYLDKEKNKCIDKKTVRCASVAYVDETGKCIMTKQQQKQWDKDVDQAVAEDEQNELYELACTQSNGKWENDKCTCPEKHRTDSDGFCTLIKNVDEPCSPDDLNAISGATKGVYKKKGTKIICFATECGTNAVQVDKRGNSMGICEATTKTDPNAFKTAEQKIKNLITQLATCMATIK